MTKKRHKLIPTCIFERSQSQSKQSHMALKSPADTGYFNYLSMRIFLDSVHTKE